MHNAKAKAHEVPPLDRLLKAAEVAAITGLHAATIWRRYTASPPTFPAPVFLGETRRWPESQIREWIAAEIAKPSGALNRGRALTAARAALRAKRAAAAAAKAEVVATATK